MKTKEVLPGQSLLDIALQESGSLEAAFPLAGLNELTITDELESGSLLTVETDENNPVVNEYRNAAVFPATALQEGLLPEGIGYMGIEIDFIVS